MQDDKQAPQPTSDMPGVSPTGQQPYTVEQPGQDGTPVPAAQTVFSPGDVLHPQQPADTAVPAETPQPAQAASTDQFAAWSAPAAPAAPVTPNATGNPAAPADPLSNANVVIPGMAGASASKRKIPKLPLIIVGGLLVLAAVGFGVYKFVLSAISLEDVTTARTSYNSLSDNAYDAGNAVRDLDTADTSAAFESKLALFESKIADAEKQYNTLKDSPVQRNKAVHEKFEAFDKKWKPYVEFLKSNAKDGKAILPIQIAFETKADELSKSTPSTTAQISAYLTEFKKLVDDTSADLKEVKLTIPENQKILEALQKFLNIASEKSAAAQKDLAAGASTYTITSHLYDLDSASYELSSELLDLQGQLNDKAELLDPADEFNAFGDSLRNLYDDLSK